MTREKRDITALKEWFLRAKRSLPWRENHTPYRVWVSEVMLQQTQVSVVIPYFERWMELFPTIEALAAADIDQVIKAWEGLGYYSRARNLHAGAKEIVCKYGGAFPNTKENLLKIKGLGSYTAGAILAFAFQERAAAVDGNVRRVLARYDAIQLSIDLPAVQKKMEERILALLPTTDAHQVMEGLIELGALICQKNPQCHNCPLSNGCKAYINGLEKELPIRRKRPKILDLHRLVWIAVQGDNVLVSKGKKGKVMADLWHFPFFELGAVIDIEVIEKELESFLGQVTYAKELDTIKHGFTRYQATLHPHVWVCATQVELVNHTWVPIDQLTSLPFCSGHRELARELKSVVLSLGV